ncbi:MAG TPA: class I SAM-dependent methyltransferase [Burkholderiales bacterium]
MSSVDTQRFSGFAKLYSVSRPQAPKEARELILQYLRKPKSELTVDLGSGTGLSTGIWRGYSARIVGVEPTPDMIRQARTDYPDVEFIEASCYRTTLPSGSADVVTCSQSFHWMEPVSTLREVDRILAKNGVFSVYDYVWPISWDWEAELAYTSLHRKVAQVLKSRPERNEKIVYFPKSEHRRNIEDSCKFRYVTEVMFDHVEDCDPERYVGMALSQGQIQKALRDGSDQTEDSIEEYRKICQRSNQKQMRVSYRMILAVK